MIVYTATCNLCKKQDQFNPITDNKPEGWLSLTKSNSRFSQEGSYGDYHFCPECVIKLDEVK